MNTDNMTIFWKFLLQKKLPANALEDMKFTVFGLGDSSYDKYNVMARKLRVRLLQLGATEVSSSTGSRCATCAVFINKDEFSGTLLCNCLHHMCIVC